MSNILKLEIDLDRLESGYDAEYVGELIRNEVDYQLKAFIRAILKKEITAHKAQLERAAKAHIKKSLANLDKLTAAVINSP